jgi:hypothetical protein
VFALKSPLGTVLVALSLAAGSGGAPAAARNCLFPANLVPNCDFAADLSEGWYFTGDSALHVPTDGATAPGCAAINRHDTLFAIEAFTGCMVVAPSSYYLAGGAARISSGSIPEECYLTVIRYSDVACGTYVAETFNELAVTTSWRDLQFPHSMGPTTHSVQIRFVCIHFSADFVIRIDDFWLAPVLFADGFESGGTSGWSATVP